MACENALRSIIKQRAVQGYGGGCAPGNVC